MSLRPAPVLSFEYGLDRYLVKQLRDFRVPTETFAYAFTHFITGHGFSMSNIDVFRTDGTLSQPGQDFVVITMSRERIEIVDFGLDGPVLSVDFYRLYAVY